MPGTNSNIIDSNNDNLKYNQLYDTRYTLMNDFTRNSIFKRALCLDNFGINCNSAISGARSTGISISGARSAETSISGARSNGISGARSIGNITCSDPHNNNCLDIYTYSDNITPAPLFTDKNYIPYNNSIVEYDINPGNLEISKMTPIEYYQSTKYYQDGTVFPLITNGIRGPIEFILNNPKNDPKNTTYYWAVDDSPTYNTFIDKQKTNENNFIRLLLHQANYKSGTITVKAYAITNGKQRSGTIIQKFIIKNYSSIATKPNSQIICPEYIEQLANWFDVDPTNNYHLYTPVGETLTYIPTPDSAVDINQPNWLYLALTNGGFGITMFLNKQVFVNSNIRLTVAEYLILSTYILWLKSFAYKGPIADARNILTLQDRSVGSNIDSSVPKTFMYGTSSINKLLDGVKLIHMISTSNQSWLRAALPKITNNTRISNINENINIPTLRFTDIYNIEQVIFRMNGNFLEFKSYGNIKLKRIVFVLDNVNNADITSILDTVYTSHSTLKITESGINSDGRQYIEVSVVNGILESKKWSKIIGLQPSQIVHYIDKVDMEINSNIINYDKYEPRLTDNIKMRYIMTGYSSGVWINISNLTPDEERKRTIELAGRYQVNYGSVYKDTKNNEYTYITDDIISSRLEIYPSTYIDVELGLVSYTMPGTTLKLNIDNNNMQQHGLYGISLSMLNKLNTINDSTDSDTSSQVNYYGVNFNDTRINSVPPDGYKGHLSSLSSISSSLDLIDWKLERILTNTITNKTIKINYIVGGTFHSYFYDYANYYISFGGIRDTTTNDTSYNTHSIIYNNKHYGYWIQDELLPTGWKTTELRLICPTNYPSNINYDGVNVVYRDYIIRLEFGNDRHVNMLRYEWLYNTYTYQNIYRYSPDNISIYVPTEKYVENESGNSAVNNIDTRIYSTESKYLKSLDTFKKINVITSDYIKYALEESNDLDNYLGEGRR